MAWSYTNLSSERTGFLLQMTAMKFLGYLNFEMLDQQTKVAQRSRHAIPCHTFRGEKWGKRQCKNDK